MMEVLRFLQADREFLRISRDIWKFRLLLCCCSFLWLVQRIASCHAHNLGQKWHNTPTLPLANVDCCFIPATEHSLWVDKYRVCTSVPQESCLFHYISPRAGSLVISDDLSVVGSFCSFLRNPSSDTTRQQHIFFLTAVVLLRVYPKEDPAKLNYIHLKQWLLYLRYAGVQHVYLYDAYKHADESQRHTLQDFIQAHFVTYHDWSHANPYSIERTQHSAYNHALSRYKNCSSWQIAIDIDEYPFSESDVAPGFLLRFVQHVHQGIDKTIFRKDSIPSDWRNVEAAVIVDEVSLDNYLLLAVQENNYTYSSSSNPFFVETFSRRTKGRANNLVKPIYRPEAIKRARVHRNELYSENRVRARAKLMRINHYWGTRLGTDLKTLTHIQDITTHDTDIFEIANNIRFCMQYLGLEIME